MITSAAPQAGANSAADPSWAWAPYAPDRQRPWTLQWAGHLFRRAGFGATWEQLQEALAGGPQRAIDQLVRRPSESATVAASAATAGQAGSLESLRAWWLRQMLETESPLQEKMTLFWHGHFGISMSRVKDARLMAAHLQTLRSHALGSYRELLRATSQDPALFLGFNAESSRKALPNENLARQLMGGLSLGPGVCDEQDVKEAARAFTGWFVLRGSLRFFEREHDSGVKTVLSQQGPWTPDDVLRIVLDRREPAQLLVRKTYRWLINEVEEPADGLLAPLVESFSKSYDMRQLVETMLRSNLFFSPVAYRQRIKSPVEFALGIVRGLAGITATLPLGAALAGLGQALGEPPTVQGWAGGRCWLNAATISGRIALARALLSPEGAYAGKPDPSTVAQANNLSDPDSAVTFFLKAYLQDDLPEETRQALQDAARAAQREPGQQWLRKTVLAVVSLPDFQLC